MKLNPQHIGEHVRDGLLPVYVVSSNEPLLVDETLAALRAAAVGHGYTEREHHVVERGFDWEACAAGLQNMSLFATRRVVELRLPTGKPGDKGSRFFVAVTAEPPPDTVIIVITPALDKRAAQSKWATSLNRAGAWIDLRAPRPQELPAWIAARLQAAGLRAERDAVQLLAGQVEGNLLAAKQEIDKLTLLATDGHVTTKTVRASVADGARFDVYQLADAALGGDTARAARILYSLEKEGVAAPLVVWSLVRESITLADLLHQVAAGRPVARAMADARIWRNRQNLYSRAMRGRDTAFARQLVTSAGHAERIVKGSRRGGPWRAMLELTMMLAGAQGWQAEIA